LPTAWVAANFSPPSVCTGTGNTNNIGIEFSIDQSGFGAPEG
jgi:hypothetical protein